MTESSNPLVQQIRETKAKSIDVAFPTMGRFYHEGVMAPEAKMDRIKINSIGLMAEMLLRDPILMASGRAIPMMTKELVPEVIEPDELVDIDMEVILLAVRIASYGPELKLDHTCENPAKHKDSEKLTCGKSNAMKINLIDHIQKYPVIEDWSPYRIEFQLSDSKSQIVHLRRMPYRSVLAGIRQTLMNESQLEPFKDMSFDQMVMSEESLTAYETMSKVINTTTLETVFQMLVGVEMLNEGESKMIFAATDADMVREWLWKIPGDWIVQLNDRINTFSKELSDRNKMSYECPHCKHLNTFNMQLDVNKLFFSKSLENLPTENPSESSTEPNKSKSRGRSKTLSR